MPRKPIQLVLMLMTVVALLLPLAVLASEGRSDNTSVVSSVLTANLSSEFVKSQSEAASNAAATSDQHQNQATSKSNSSVMIIENVGQRDEHAKNEVAEVLETNAVAISAGYYHTCVLTEGGGVKGASPHQ